MAEIYLSTDAVLPINDYHKDIIEATKLESVIQSILPHGQAPVNWKKEYEVKEGAKPYNLAAHEGGDVDQSTFVKRINLKIANEMQYFRTQRGFFVSRLAEKMPGYTQKYGISKLAEAQADDAAELSISIDTTFGSSQEAQVEGSNSTAIGLTRGICAWLTPNTEHTVDPIPAAIRPKVGLTGNVTNPDVYNEDKFAEMLLAAALERGDQQLQITGLVGAKLQQLMANWMGKATHVVGLGTKDEAATNAILCDVYKYHSVTARLIPCNHINSSMGSTAGAAVTVNADAQLYSGAFIVPKLWEIQTLVPISMFMLPDMGGGKRGFHEYCGRLNCLNPLGQFAIKYKAS